MQVSCENLDLEYFRRIGKKGEKSRPIVITLTTMSKKIDLFKNRRNLEKSLYYIKEDFTPKILKTRKLLIPELKQKIEQRERAILKYDKIVILKKKREQTNITYQPNNKRNFSTSPEEQTPLEDTNKFTKEIPKRNKVNMNQYIKKSSRDNSSMSQNKNNCE
ncbi:unnamed protein product [Parnassius apollo]|uniref:(apollo) hypothetical protein n=1 Tax=Parnassius apollo TaxID=110799 RepID=A0A8S3XLY1_PARAO|nr:unnamed protein product [Parnassius apollo]